MTVTVTNYPDFIPNWVTELALEVTKLRELAKQRRQLVYLASPYSDPLITVRLRRFETACKVAAKLMAEGIFVYSPIAHTHPIAEASNLPLGFEFWERYDRAILQCCHKMIVIQLPGWEQSKGIAAELEIAKELGIPVEYMEP